MSGTSRSRLRRLQAAISATAGVAVFGWAVPASAAMSVGQLAPAPPGATCSGAGAGYDYLQPSVTGENLYSARAAGTITSWSTSSSGAGASYVLKVFRRTSDPDAFQVVGRAAEQTLRAGINTFPAGLQVRSGDLIGLHEEGPGSNSCTFPMPGDGVLQAPGDLTVGRPAAQFTPVPDVRLNLSAVLVPSNAFTITEISRNRRNGTARLSAELSNPGLATIVGRGLKSRHVSRAVAGGVSLKVETTGKFRRRLYRRGRLRVPVTVTFYPTGGDASSQMVSVKLRRRTAVRGPMPGSE